MKKRTVIPICALAGLVGIKSVESFNSHTKPIYKTGYVRMVDENELIFEERGVKLFFCVYGDCEIPATTQEGERVYINATSDYHISTKNMSILERLLFKDDKVVNSAKSNITQMVRKYVSTLTEDNFYNNETILDEFTNLVKDGINKEYNKSGLYIDNLVLTVCNKHKSEDENDKRRVPDKGRFEI